jgi:hypothetical protein
MPHSSGFARVRHARQHDQQIRINRILEGSPLASAGMPAATISLFDGGGIERREAIFPRYWYTCYGC